MKPQIFMPFHDAKRSLLYNRSIIEEASLQTYCSVLMFTREESIVRKQFENHTFLDLQEAKSASEMERNAADARGPFRRGHLSSILAGRQANGVGLRGRALELGVLDVSSLQLSLDPLEQLCTLFVSNDWVSEEGTNILRLSPDYRATCVAVRGGMVVLAHSSGGMSFLEVKDRITVLHT
jgi:hypothetical protein